MNRNRLIRWWDRLVYRLCWRSLQRMCKTDRGFCYLLELHLREWRSRFPLTPELQASTESFFNSLIDEAKHECS